MTERQAKQRFVWPPRPVEVMTQEAPLSAAPPERAGQLPGAAVDETAPESTLSGAARGLYEIESVWLGLVSPPWATRAALAGWQPDRPGSACPRCGTSVGPHELLSSDRLGTHCPACATSRLPWSRFIRLAEYEGALREAIHELKFSAFREVGHELGLLLGRRIAAELDRRGVPRELVAIVPMPTTFRRRLFRGIDHTGAIARAVREVTGGRLVRALSRLHRPSQVEVAPSERKSNVAGVFRRERGVDLRGMVAVVVDDVATTGATMTAACRELGAGERKNSAKAGERVQKGGEIGGLPREVWAAVLGVTPDQTWRGVGGMGGG